MKIFILAFLLSSPVFSNSVDQLLKECSPTAVVNNLKRMKQFDEDRFDYKLTDAHIKMALGEEFLPSAISGKQKIRGRENRRTWIYHEDNEFSDPLFHYDENDKNPTEEDKEYQYIMHVLDPNKGDGGDVLKDPFNYFKNQKRISTSFIHEKDTVPFYKTGGVVILVKLEPQFIVAASSKNLSSLDSTFASANNKGSIMTPDEMRKRHPGTNNEILSSGGVTPIGLGIFGNSGKPLYNLYDERSISHMSSACKRYNLPVVLLEKTNPKRR